jgi:predicted RNase H-like HicB family nuclease
VSAVPELRYQVVVTELPHVYRARIEELKCERFGSTAEEAVMKIQEQAEKALEMMALRNRSLPKPLKQVVREITLPRPKKPRKLVLIREPEASAVRAASHPIFDA